MTDDSPQLDERALQAAIEAVEALPRRRDQLLPCLLAAQHAIGWLPRPAIELVARHTRIPLSEVYATTTAYAELRLAPPVPGEWRVCTGVACREAGADALIGALSALDGAGAPHSTATTDCRFLCALAPVVEDEHESLFGRCTPERLRALAQAPGGVFA